MGTECSPQVTAVWGPIAAEHVGLGAKGTNPSVQQQAIVRRERTTNSFYFLLNYPPWTVPRREGKPTSSAALSESFYLRFSLGKHGRGLILGKSRGRGVACDSFCFCSPRNRLSPCHGMGKEGFFSQPLRCLLSVGAPQHLPAAVFAGWVLAALARRCREPIGKTRGSCCGWFPVQDGSWLG